jgi:hypothetical protein
VWNKSARLAIGILLLATGGFFILRVANGWKPLWQQQAARAVTPWSDATPSQPDPDVAAANLKVYGVLGSAASPTRAQGDNAAPPRLRAAIDHVVAAPADAPKHFLRQRFAIQTYEGFEFIIPAHAVHPRLQGSFKSFLRRGGVNANGKTAIVDLLLLNEQEFSDFQRGDNGTATFSNEATDSGEVDLALGAPMFHPQRYYLIFRNSSGRPRTKLVTADFSVSFD